ncbi:diguanylate cyclase [bacterium]|nr:diguanylate cyclase [bacterium]
MWILLLISSFLFMGTTSSLPDILRYNLIKKTKPSAMKIEMYKEFMPNHSLSDRGSIDILVIEDSKIDARVIQESLGDTYTLHFLGNAIEALDYLCHKTAPDLILLDIVIPGVLDGFQLCKKIKQEPHLKNVPIIFTTGKASADDEIKGLEHGAVDYISKPIRPPIIQARVKNHIELKRNRDRSENLSFQDGLTGIANRRRFDNYLDLSWVNCQKKNEPLSVILLDIDFFKQYNDHYGHPAGDAALQKVAKGLSSAIKRPIDLLARYGGEEFAVVMPKIGITGVQFFAKLVKHCIHNLHIEHQYSSISDRLTLSMGGATIIPRETGTIDYLLQEVDKQLYCAKKNGRNQSREIDLRP